VTAPTNDRRDGDQRPRDLALGPAIDEERIAATWQRIARARAERPERRGRRTLALAGFAAATAAAAIAAAVLLPRGAAPGPLTSRDPAIAIDTGDLIETPPHPLVLDDGSTVGLDADARLHVLANDGRQFVTLLDRGAARFEVTPGGPRRWTVETPLASVEVVGTVFRVDAAPGRLVVEVERGTVFVRGDRVPGRVAQLRAGERLVVGAAEKTAAAAPQQPPPVAIAEAPPSPPSPPSPHPAPARAPAAPLRAVAAPDPLLAARPAATTDAPLPVDEALREADRLRGEHRAAAAVAALERALAADPGHPAAGLAAFTIGRISSDVLDQPERAARAFAQMIEIGRPSSLVEDAHVRRIEALLRAGQRREAALAIDALERAFPTGHRAASLRARLSAP